MDLRELGTPAQLWRRWVLVSAARAASGGSDVEIRRSDGAGRLESGEGPGAAWLRMRRMAGNRAVLWGVHPGLESGPRFRDELRDAAPDWSYDVDSGYAAQAIGFLGWYAHGSWSSVPCPPPRQVTDLLAPVWSDQAVLDRWLHAWPDAAPDLVEAALAEPSATSLGAVMGRPAATKAMRQVGLADVWAGRQLSDAATTHLRTQIHAQMRGAAELADRGLAKRPPLLRQWGRVNLTGTPFRHSVCAVRSTGSRGGLVAGVAGTGLDEAQRRSLDNVLLELRMAETDEKSGAWLFARVSSDGRQLGLERRFDGWPAWYTAPGGTTGGPTMSALFAEMEQRAPIWRPGWATLIPTDRY